MRRKKCSSKIKNRYAHTYRFLNRWLVDIIDMKINKTNLSEWTIEREK